MENWFLTVFLGNLWFYTAMQILSDYQNIQSNLVQDYLNW